MTSSVSGNTTTLSFNGGIDTTPLIPFISGVFPNVFGGGVVANNGLIEGGSGGALAPSTSYVLNTVSGHVDFNSGPNTFATSTTGMPKIFTFNSPLNTLILGEDFSAGGTFNISATADFNGTPNALQWDLTPFALTLPGGQRIVFFYDGTQLFESAIPFNQIMGQIASGIHNTGTRDFNSRLFRVRNRYESPDGVAQNETFSGRGRDVSASRFLQMDSDLSINRTINLSGVQATEYIHSSTPAPFSTLENSTLSVTRQTGAMCDPGCLAAGDNWILFGSANFGNVDLEPFRQNPGLESTTQGSSLGVEYLLNDQIAVGAGWSHLWNDSDFNNNLGGAEIEGDIGVIYATYFKDNLWSDLMYSYGSYEADLRRNTGGGTTVTANPDLDTHQTAFNLGYNFGLCGGDIVHGPTLGATYTSGSLDGYTESGDPQRSVTFTDQFFESFVTTVGWQVNWKQETSFGLMRPQLRLGYGRENIDQDQTVQAVVPVLGGLVTASQEAPGENWVDFGAGVSFEINRCMSLFLDYNGQFFREDAQIHYGTVRAQVNF